jgi:PAS domain S-box-containing protein
MDKIMFEEEKPNDAIGLVKKFQDQDAQRIQKAASDRALFAHAVKSSLEGVVVVVLYGYITDVNDSVLEMFGAADKRDVVGKHVFNFTSKKDRKRAADDSMRLLMTGKGSKSQYLALTKSGQEVLVEVTTEFINDENGEKIGFVHIVKPLNWSPEKK